MSVLVLGASGQVGSHLRGRLEGAAFWSRHDADLSDPETLEARVRGSAPRAVVNCAAYTAVDRAETDAVTAWRVNAESPARLAAVCADLAIPLIHVSTDYVFDGARPGAYTEADGVNPLNVYGRTKLAGELAVASLTPAYWILRTSWVFSEHGGNFVKTMLRLAGERPSLSVVDDQRGRPSYAGDLAALIAALLDAIGKDGAPASGVYHTGGGPETTWFGFARVIFDRALARGLIDRLPEIVPVPSTEFPTAAARSRNSVLAPNVDLQRTLGVHPDWRSGLDRMLDALLTGSASTA